MDPKSDGVKLPTTVEEHWFVSKFKKFLMNDRLDFYHQNLGEEINLAERN